MHGSLASELMWLSHNRAMARIWSEGTAHRLDSHPQTSPVPQRLWSGEAESLAELPVRG
jgi:hypothetical protein